MGMFGERAYHQGLKINNRLKREMEERNTRVKALADTFNKNGQWDFGAYQLKKLRAVNGAIAIVGTCGTAGGGGTTVGP